MQLEDILEKLIRPFEPSQHKERKIKGGGTWYFIGHQCITNRLNEVCPGHWSDRYTLSHQEPDGDPIYFCELTICGVTRTGIGDKSNEDSHYGTPSQRSFRKAFTDAAEKFNIAAYLDEQSQDKREFLMRYLHSQGDGRALSAARSNGWTPGNLPTAQQKQARAAAEQAQTRAAGMKISEAQRKRLWAIAKTEGKFTDAGAKRLVERFGFASSKDITTDKYNEICEWAKDPAMAAIYNVEPPEESPSEQAG